MAVDNHDSEGTESADNFVVSIYKKILSNKLFIILSNFVCMVLFLEKEPKHPIIKFFVVVTLLCIVVSGFWQVIEARKANEIANESLKVSNKMAAYSILSNQDVSNESFVDAYNFLSKINNSNTIDIKNRMTSPNLPFEFYGKDKEVKVKIYDSNLIVKNSKSKRTYFGLYNSDISFIYDDLRYSSFGLYNSNLSLYDFCQKNEYKYIFNSGRSLNDCFGERRSYMDFKLRGESNIYLAGLKDSILNFSFVSRGCKYLDVGVESSFCIPKDEIKMSSYSGFESKYLKSAITSDNSHEFFKKYKEENKNRFSKTLYLDSVKNIIITSSYDSHLQHEEDVDIHYMINDSSNVLFIDEADSNHGNYYAFSSSVIEYNSNQILNSKFYIKDDSKIYFSFKKIEEIESHLGFSYYGFYIYNCLYNAQKIYLELLYDRDGFYESFTCDGLTDENDELFEFGWKTIPNYEDKNLFESDFKKTIDHYKDQSSRMGYEDTPVFNAKFTISDGGFVSFEKYSFFNSEIIIYSGFTGLEIKDSKIGPSSSIKFYLGDTRDDDSLILCKRIKSLFENKENFKGTVIKRSNIKIIPEGACALDEGLFQ